MSSVMFRNNFSYVCESRGAELSTTAVTFPRSLPILARDHQVHICVSSADIFINLH